MVNERRGFGRFGTALRGAYELSDRQVGVMHECLITNMSRKGFGLLIESDENIREDAAVQLTIYIPEKPDPTRVRGRVKWIEKRDRTWAVGIECEHILNEFEFSKRR